ncbi:MAG TPA: peptide synthetase, partial [Roseovarius nubinhibens]|nr:peptide synthetase [Roseovarius nubinhibens]
MSKLSCVLIGDASLTIGCGTLWREAGHVIRAVVSQDQAVRDWAQAEGLAVLSTPEALHGLAGETRFDWLLSVAYLALLPEDVLRLAGKGAVNFHDGPLPGYAGLNTPVWAKLAGETEHAITWHRMDAGIDTGAVLLDRRFDIRPEDTAQRLNTKAYAAGLETFPELIERLARGEGDGVPQPEGTRRLCRRDDRPAAGGCLDLAQGQDAVIRLVRGLDFGEYWNPL